MGAPSASFTFEVLSGYKVIFTDTSTPNPDPINQWAWDFGGLASSSDQSPHYTFPGAGTYAVKLTVTDNVSGTGNTTINVEIAVSQVGGVVGDEICCRIPPSLCSSDCVPKFVKKWQYYLANQKNPELTLDADIIDQANWEYLENVVIAELTVYETIMAEGSKWMASGNLNFDPASSTNTSIKKIKTGPSESEWWDNQDNQTKLFKELMTEGGAMDRYGKHICNTLKRLGFFVPEFCESKIFGVLPKKAGRNTSNTPTYGNWPTWLR